jgi:hypothetical protein
MYLEDNLSNDISTNELTNCIKNDLIREEDNVLLKKVMRN